MKRLMVFLLLAASAHAQSTIVTTNTVGGKGLRDANGIVWSNGTYFFDFVGPSSVAWPGGALPRHITGKLGANGVFTASVPDNNTITPGPSSWTVTLCPNNAVTGGADQCSITTNIFVTGPSLQLNITPDPITIPGTTKPPVAAYDDSEITAPVVVGLNYLNIESLSAPVIRTCLAVSSSGNCAKWIDAPGAVGGLPTIPSAHLLFVDGTRTDTYTADGTLGTPFKTIMAAVNQIVSNGDNAPPTPVIYRIQVNPAVYNESIDLSNPKLSALVFTGYGATVAGTQTMLKIRNNDGMSDVLFYGFLFDFTGSTAPFFDIGSSTNNTNFLSGTYYSLGLQFLDTSFIGTGNANIGQAQNCVFDRTFFPQSSPNFTFTNDSLVVMRNTQVSQGGTANLVTDTTQPIPSGFSATQLQLRHSSTRLAVTIGAGSQLVLADGVRIINTITVNGLLRNFNSVTTGAVVVNSGGTYRCEAGCVNAGTVTLNSGSTFQPLGTYGMNDLFLGQQQHILGGTATPNGVVVGNPGDLYLCTTGGAGQTLWIKESGVGTNTGWNNK
jgi:hypothetical protein